MPSFSAGVYSRSFRPPEICSKLRTSRGALGAGLAFFSRFPITGATSHPYSLAGSPLDVLGGDWFVGKAAVSVLLAHPVLGQLEVFNSHVSRVYTSPPPARETDVINFASYTLGAERLGLNIRGRIDSSIRGSWPSSFDNRPKVGDS